MKKLLLPVILGLAFSAPTLAQDDEKPSWSEDLPEKVEAPDMEVLKETRKKIKLDLDMSDLGRRPDVFAEDADEEGGAGDAADATTASGSVSEQEKPSQAEQRLAAEAEARRQEKLKQEEEKREQQRLAEEKARQEQERLAAEKARQEQERLAAEKARQEQERLAAEKARQEQERLAAEKARQEQERLAAEERQRQLEAERKAEAARRQELQQAEEAQRAALAAQKAAEAAGNPPSTSQPEPSATSSSAESDKTAQEPYRWKFIHKVAPDYPVKAYRERKEGWVDVEVTIDPQGVVQDAKVVKIYRNQRVFAKPAIKAVRQWRFEPPQKYGISQPQKRRYRVEFKLQGEAALPGADKKTAATGA